MKYIEVKHSPVVEIYDNLRENNEVSFNLNTLSKGTMFGFLMNNHEFAINLSIIQ